MVQNLKKKPEEQEPEQPEPEAVKDEPVEEAEFDLSGLDDTDPDSFDLEGIENAFEPEPAIAEPAQPLPPTDTGIHVSEEIGADREGATSLVQAKQATELNDQAGDFLVLGEEDATQKVAKAREALAKERVGTFGEAYIEIVAPNATPADNIEFGARTDAKVVSEEHDTLIAQEIDGPNAEGLTITMAADRDFMPDVVREIVGSAKAGTLPGGTFEAIRSWDDFVEFFDPVPFEGAMDVNWGEFFDIMINGGDLEPWKVAMVDNYGEDWMGRWFAWGVKELAVDATILAVGALLPFTAPLLYAGKFATLSMRARAVLGRAVAIGVGGAEVQRQITNHLGGDYEFFSTRFGAEALLRGGASLGGEVVFKAGAVGIKAVLGKHRVALAGVQGVKPIAAKTLRAIIKPHKYKPAAMSNGNAINLKTIVNDYGRLAQKIAQGFTKNTIPKGQKGNIEVANAMRKRSAQILGVNVNELDMAILAKVINKEVQIPTGGQAIGSAKSAVTREGTKLKKIDVTIKKLVAQNKKNPNVAPATKRARFARLKAARAEKKSIKESQKLAQAELKLTTKQIESATDNALHDAILNGEAVSMRVMSQFTDRQDRVIEEFLTFFNRETFQPRADTATIDKAYLPLFTEMKRFLNLEEVEVAFGPLGADLFDSMNISANVGKSFTIMMDDAFSGLTGGGRAKVMRALEMGGEHERVWTPDELIAKFNLQNDVKGFGMSGAEIDSYYAVRSILDIAHHVYDRALVEGLTKRGVFNYKGKPHQIIADEPSKSIGKTEINKGLVRIQEIARSGAPKPKAFNTHRGNLTDLESVLRYEVGYTPRVYSKARFSVSLIDGTTGSVGKVSQFFTQNQALKSMKARERLATKGQMIVMSSFDADLNTGSIRMGKQTIELMDALDPATREIIKKELLAEGFSPAGIRKVINNLDGSSMRTRFAGQRSERGLAGKKSEPFDLELIELRQARAAAKTKEEKAVFDERIKNTERAFKEAQKGELVPTGRAIAEYLNAVAVRAGTTLWREHSIKVFRTQFKNELDPQKAWFDPSNVRTDFKGNQLQHDLRVQKMQRMRKWLTKVIRSKTTHEQGFDNFMTRLETKALDINPALAGFIAHLPGSQTMVNALRGTAAVTKLGSFAMAQVFVQSSQMAVTLGAKPRWAVFGMHDMIEATVGSLQVGARGRNPISLNMRDAQRAGYFSDLKTNDITNFIPHIGNGMRAPMDAIGNTARKAFNASLMPFRAGEALNRGFAFFTVRREFMALVRKGKLANKDNTGFIKLSEIKEGNQSIEFLSLVTNQAKLLALNMGKAGELQGLSGGFSVLFQFKQVIFKFINVFETKQLKPIEKFGAAASMFGLWGVTAVPLMSDLFAGADYLVGFVFDRKPTKLEVFTDLSRSGGKFLAESLHDLTPEFAQAYGMDKKFYNKFFRDGLIAAATKTWTESEWNISNRVALGKFIQDTFEVQNAEDWVVSVATLWDLADAVASTGSHELLNIGTWLEIRGRMADGTSFEDAFKEFYEGTDPSLISDVLSGDRTIGNASLAMTRNVGKGVASLGAWSRALDATNREIEQPRFRSDIQGPIQENVFSTSSGRRVAVKVNRSRLIQLIFGITPGRMLQGYRTERWEKIVVKAYEDWLTTMVNRIVDLPAGAMFGSNGMLNEVYEETDNLIQYMAANGLKTDKIPGDIVNSMHTRILSAIDKKMHPEPIKD